MQYPNIVNNTASKLLLGLLLGVVALSAQAKMYKWVDPQGNVHYTDALPPTAAAQGNAEISNTGNVVKKTESAGEREKRLAAEAVEAERRKHVEEQARKDRALLATYTSEKEIDLARDRTIEHHKLAIDSANSRLKQIQPEMDELQKKMKMATKGGKAAPAHLQKQYDAKKEEMDGISLSIKTSENEISETYYRYEADKQRFHEISVKR